jgi:cytoplasmic iron level regulating protein YaaA (DUF328/UPF0246 family)
MLTVISPAKTLDYETPTTTSEYTQPTQLTQSRKLIRRLREFGSEDISRLMNVSDNLAELNRQRYRKWKTPFKPENARQALFAFKGDVYQGLDAYSLDEDGLEFAQQHLRILSGLYGILRPLDLMQPYRLEMGTRLSTEQGSNLASNEYFKAVKPKLLKAEIVTPTFREFHKGEYRFISFTAKKARGLMARYMIDHRIDRPEGLKDFDYEGYRFAPKLSVDADWVFTRK